MFSLTEQKCPAHLTATSQSYSQSAATEHHLLASSDTSCTPWRATSRTSTTTIPLSRTSCWQDAHISSTCCQCCWFFWWRTVKAKIRANQWSWTPIQQAIPHELHYIMVEKKWHANAACLIDVQHRTGRSDVLRVKSQKRTSHGNMKTTKLLSHIETKKVFNLGADTSTVERLSPSRGGALASATCDHVWKGPRPSDRGRSSRAWTLRASWWAWFVPNSLMNPQPNHSPGTSRTPKRRRAGRREAAASLHEARSMVLARPWRRQRAPFLLQQDQHDNQPWWPWLWATSLKRRRSCGGTWCKKWVDHHAADGETKDRSTMHSSTKLAQILSPTKLVSIAMSSANVFLFHKTAQRWNSEMWLISKKNRNHVVVRFLQHQHVPRPNNEQLDVVGSVAIYKRACSHNNSLFPLLSWWCNGLPFPDNRSPKLGAGGNVSMDGTTDRFFLAGIRRERFLRLHATEKKRQQKITGGKRLSFWYAEWAVDQAAGQHVQYLCMWRHRNLTCPIIPILWKRSSRSIPLLPHRLHCESCEHGRVNCGDQRMLCHSQTWKQRWSETWVPTCYHWLSLSLYLVFACMALAPHHAWLNPCTARM